MRKNRILVFMMTLALTVSAISCRRTENRETEIEPTATEASLEATAEPVSSQANTETTEEKVSEACSEVTEEQSIGETEEEQVTETNTSKTESGESGKTSSTKSGGNKSNKTPSTKASSEKSDKTTGTKESNEKNDKPSGTKANKETTAATGGSKETTAVQATTQASDENDKEPTKDQPSEGFPEMKLVTTELGQKILDGLDIMTINEVLADISPIDLAGYEASGLETSTTNVKTASGLSARVEYQRDEADGEVNHFLTITTDHYTVDFYKLDHTAPYGGKHISLTMYSLTDEAPFQECAAFGYGDYYDEEEAKDYAEISMIEYLDEEGSYCIYTPPFYDEEEYVTVEVEKENCTADTELLQVLAVEPAVNEIALSISNGTKYYYNDAGEWFAEGSVVVSFTDAEAMNTFFTEYSNDRMEPDLMYENCLIIRSMIIPVYDDVLIDGDHFEYFVTDYLDESFFGKLHLDEEGKVYEISWSNLTNAY